LHFEAQIGRLHFRLRMPDFVQPVERLGARTRRQIAMFGTGLDDFGRSICRRPSKDDQVEQAVRPKSIGAMDGNASRLANRHKTRHDLVGVIVRGTNDFATIVRRYTAHIVVDGRQNWDRLFRHVDPGKHLRGFGNSRQAFKNNVRVQML